MSKRRIWILSPTWPPAICGVGAHTLKLAAHLAQQHPNIEWVIITSLWPDTENPLRQSHAENITLRPIIQQWDAPDIVEQLLGLFAQIPADAVLVQYTPHLYQRWGVNFKIIHALERLVQQACPVFPILHELYVPIDSHWKHWITGPLQRRMMHRLLTLCSGAFVSTASRQQHLQQTYPPFHDKLHVVPVSSNIEIATSTPDELHAMRAWANALDKQLLLFWGKLHTSKYVHWTLQAIDSAQKQGISLQAVYIGPDEASLEALITQQFAHLRPLIHQTGVLPDDEVSLYLQTADMLLYPLEDGASARRGALMAALQHGTRTITTIGPSTDSVMAHCPHLIFSNTPSDFTQQVLHACTQPWPQANQEAMQHYFNAHYSWASIAQSIGRVVLPTTAALE